MTSSIAAVLAGSGQYGVACGDARAVLCTLPDACVQMVCTSPPYWGLRAYGTEHQVWGGDPACEHVWDALETREITGGGGNKGNAGSFVPVGACGACGACGAWAGEMGLEPTPELYVAHLVELFRAVRRVLRDDGTLWLNLGDCYATGAGAVGDHPGGGEQGARWRGDVDRLRDDGYRGERLANGRGDQPAILRTKTVGRGAHTVENSGKAAPRIATMGPMTQPNRMPIPGLKPKDLVGIPWRVAFALQADGWWLRSDIIWAKPNPMPESVLDRPTKAHEYMFLLAKSERYYYTAEAIAEPAIHEGRVVEYDGTQKVAQDGYSINNRRAPGNPGGSQRVVVGATRNRRSVWTVATQPFAEAHFAVMPQALVEPCVLAGSRPGDMVLDTFCGSGTVGVVALRHGRRFLGVELNPDYVRMARRRIAGPLFADQGSEASA